jgi:hypothetical protein
LLTTALLLLLLSDLSAFHRLIISSTTKTRRCLHCWAKEKTGTTAVAGESGWSNRRKGPSPSSKWSRSSMWCGGWHVHVP